MARHAEAAAGQATEVVPEVVVQVYNVVSGTPVATLRADPAVPADRLKRQLAAACGTAVRHVRLLFDGEEVEGCWKVPLTGEPVQLGMLKVLSSVQVVARPAVGPPIELHFQVDLSAETVGDLKSRIEVATLHDELLGSRAAADRYYPKPRQRLSIAGEALNDDGKMLVDCGGIHFQGVAVECEG